MKKRNIYLVLCILLGLNHPIQTLAQFPVNLSNGSVFEGEPFIAVNPTSPQNLSVAWMGFVFNSGVALTIKVSSTFDGGQTWSTAVNIPHVSNNYKSADPSMCFDQQGNLYLSYIDYRENPDSGGVFIRKSTDGGLTWSTEIQVIDMLSDGTELPIDRPWLSVNSQGDKMYITTKPAPWILAPNRSYFIASSDSGNTWQPWRYIDTTGYLIGNFIAQPMSAVAAYGDLCYAAFPSYVPAQNVYPQYLLAKTNNSGQSFSYTSIYAGNASVGNDTPKLGHKLLVNPTDSLHLVFVFPYQPYGDIDILCCESFDGGVSWSAPIRINDDPQGNGKMQDLMWAAFDNDGDLLISWRDRRNATGSGFETASSFYYAYRSQDSLNFSPNIALTDSLVPYDVILAESGNDFMSIVLLNDTLSATWGDTRDGSLNIWFTRMYAPTGTSTGISLIYRDEPNLLMYPNPTADKVFIDSKTNFKPEKYRIFTSAGQLILEEKCEKDIKSIDLNGFADGIYLIELTAKEKVYKRKITKISK